MLKEIQRKPFILTMFVRDDAQRFLLGSGFYEFKDGQMHFAGNTIVSDVVEVQGNDGALLAGQVRRAASQEFKGYIGDHSCSKTKIEELRQNFMRFFRPNHFYEVIYIFANGTAIKRQRGYLTDAPEVQEFWQIAPEYSVALNFEDVNYYQYLEDQEGREIYGNIVDINSSDATGGGLIWDEIGIVWDEIGATWEQGSGGQNIINISGVDNIFPIWRVPAGTSNPVIENTTTGARLVYNGTIAAGQTLVVDCVRQTAKLNGLNVIQNISGEWLTLKPGINRISYIADSTTTKKSTIEWAEIVG